MAKGAPPIDEAPEGRSVAPGELRGQLAADLGDDYDLLHATLQAAMGNAEKDAWLSCRDCGAKRVYCAPDHRTRLEAASKWLELGLGRKREEEKRPEVSLMAMMAKSAEDMRALSDEELRAIVAAGE